MARKFIKKYLPDTKNIKNHKYLKMFGSRMHNPNLWHLNRYSVATAFSTGLFAAFIPVPFQMVLAAALGILFRANLPISVALVWLTNPVTMPPIFYFAFKIGAFVLNIPHTAFYFEPSVEWMTSGFLHVWKPFLLGCFIVGGTIALLSNLMIRLFWRISVSLSWRRRRLHRKRTRAIAEGK